MGDRQSSSSKWPATGRHRDLCNRWRSVTDYENAGSSHPVLTCNFPIACGCVTSARRSQVDQHSSASASRLLGLDGFAVLAAEVVAGEWQFVVQTTVTVVGCTSCGVRSALTAAGRSECVTCPLVAGRWCRCGASAFGAALSPPARCGPGPSRRPDPPQGGADPAGPRRGVSSGRQGRPCGGGGRP